MVVKNPGNTNSFSGNGSLNPKLWVPGISSIKDTAVRTAILKIQQWCQEVVSTGLGAVSHTYAVSGTLTVPSGAAGYLPPFFMPVSGDQGVVLYEIVTEVRAGSCDINIEHNGAVIGSCTATTSEQSFSIGAQVSNGDSFQPVITSVTGADGLSCSFWFGING